AAIAVVAAAVYLWLAIRRAPYTGAWSFGPAIEPVRPGSATRAIVRLALLAAVALLLSWQVPVVPGSPGRLPAPPEDVVGPPVSGPVGPALPSTIIVGASVGAVLILVALSVAAVMARRRRRLARHGPDPSTPVTPPTPVELAVAAMEALREESDPRLAILAA